MSEERAEYVVGPPEKMVGASVTLGVKTFTIELPCRSLGEAIAQAEARDYEQVMS